MSRPDALTPTGELVIRLWELETPVEVLPGWQPLGSIEPSIRLPWRWIGVAASLLAALTAWGVWQAVVPDSSQRASRVAELAADLSDQSQAAAARAEQWFSDQAVTGPGLADLDKSAQDMFDLAETFPEGDRARLRAIDAAQAGLDLEAWLGSVAAYRATADAVLLAPEFPSVVRRLEIGGTATQVATWVTGAQEILSNVPTALPEDHREAAAGLATFLGTWQSGYLDALRAENEGAARQAIEQRDRRLSEFAGDLDETMSEMVREAATKAALIVKLTGGLNPVG